MTKDTGISIYERLLFLETKIQFFVSNFLAGGFDIQKKADGYAKQPAQHFKAIAFITEKGEQSPITGVIENPPEITPKEIQHIQSGKTVILSKKHSELPSRIFMIMLADHKNSKAGIVLGEINADYLWGISDKDALISPSMIPEIGRAHV